jgi:exonuclease III
MNTSGEQNIPKPVHSSTPEQMEKTTRKEPFMPLRILNVNCQSIKNKQHQTQNLVDSTKPDVIIATETWLDPTITNSQIFPPNYNIYRKDRKGTKTGGGVLIAINDKYLSSEIPELDTDCEIIWCKIQQKGNKDLYICSYYNPKMSDSESMTEFETSVQRAAANNPCLLIGGDFNLPGWN